MYECFISTFYRFKCCWVSQRGNAQRHSWTGTLWSLSIISAMHISMIHASMQWYTLYLWRKVSNKTFQSFLNNIWIKSAFKTDIFFSFHLDFQPSLKKSLESALNPWVGKCLATFFLFSFATLTLLFSQVFPNQNFASRQTHMSFNMGYTCLIWKTQICTFFLSFIKGCF